MSISGASPHCVSARVYVYVVCVCVSQVRMCVLLCVSVFAPGVYSAVCVCVFKLEQTDRGNKR